MKALEGYKTYLAAGLGILAALTLLWIGAATPEGAVALITFCLVAAGFRSALNTVVAQALVDAVTKLLEQQRRDPMKPAKKLGAVLILLSVALSVTACGDFERRAWVTLRDADAAIESATTTWEGWKAEQPRLFTDAELDQVRATLQQGNEALSAAEAAFSAYRAAQRGLDLGQKSGADLAAARQHLQEALDALTRAVASIRTLIDAFSHRSTGAVEPVIKHAGLDPNFVIVLIGLLGAFAGAVLTGKTAAISKAALDLIAAVLATHKQATGEDIDLALPALRKRIEERRKLLKK